MNDDNDFKIYFINSFEEKIKYIKDNTNILYDINENDIKQIESDYYNSIYILLKNGTLYKNKQIIKYNVSKLWFMDGFCIFGIMNNNTVESITFQYALNDYISGIEYKKVITSTLYLFALTNDNKVKCIFTDPTGLGIIPDNFVNVDDILFKSELETPYVVKNGKEIPLFVSECE